MPIIPRSMVVVGAGIIGCEYSSIFATLGTEVSLVDWRDQPLGFADRESVNALIYHNPSCLL
jgi:NAD(P) transhydrogenase